MKNISQFLKENMDINEASMKPCLCQYIALDGIYEAKFKAQDEWEVCKMISEHLQWGEGGENCEPTQFD